MNRNVVNFSTRNSTVGDRLARGYGSQLIERQKEKNCNIEEVFKLLFNLNPNRKSYFRTKKKLENLNGVVKCGMSKEEVPTLQIVFRSYFLSKIIQEDMGSFEERVISFTRLDAWSSGSEVAVCACRVFFSIHALQRFIQRTNIDYRDGLENAVDLEGLNCVNALKRGDLLGSDTYSYAASNKFIGAWPGEVSQSLKETGWPQPSSGDHSKIKTLSIRTFLSPDEMSPQVYLQWKDDPNCNFLQSA
jgi:hypothetical protein